MSKVNGIGNALIVGDVGGTNIRIGLVDKLNNVNNIVRLKCDQFSNFEEGFSEALKAYDINLSQLSVVLAVAGPVENDNVNFINRDWSINGQFLKSKFGFKSVTLINDFVAMARCVPELRPENIITINKGITDTNAPIIVAGPGTGFGVATLIKNNGSWRVIAGEGGYHSFAPRTKIEIEVVNILSEKFDFISTELICAGVGLPYIHESLCEIFRRNYEYTSPNIMREKASAGDEMFLELCKMRARATLMALGDMALINGALGGVYIAGGAAIHLESYFKQPESLNRFYQRGLKSDYLKSCPINLINDPVAALTGAASFFYD